LGFAMVTGLEDGFHIRTSITNNRTAARG
jgi:hypothetical protein